MPDPVQTDAYTPPSQAGDQIGPYKLLQQLGHGGMGEVWMAEQSQPVHRRVAIKLNKAGMDSRAVLARFEAERQALAMMDHPNIAKVLDAGATDNGRPYFVMELVKGIPLVKYCDQEHLTPRERLELFIPVCQAVQHAHQKGIIHRDLKPSNIIVGLYDGKPVPKVIDFGIAKATHQKLSDQTLFTEVGQIIGTLAYMAPEQAELNNLDIDTRADIYSLGVILYELLAGSPPFSAQQLREAGFDEARRVIREVEPQKPSTKLSSSDQLPSLAAARKLEPRHLTRIVRGELDCVVMKCLEKDRARRYETANGLAADVQRYLSDEPVLARPASAAFRLSRFARRHRAAVLVTATIVFLLVGGITGTTTGLIEARRQRDVATANEQAEAKAKETAESVLGFLEENIFREERKRFSKRLYTIPSINEIAKAAIPVLSERFTSEPLVEARLRVALGCLIESAQAVEEIQKARTLVSQHLGPVHPLTLSTVNKLARHYGNLKRHNEAITLLEGVSVQMKAAFGCDHLETLRGLEMLAENYTAVGRHFDAIALHHEIFRLRSAKFGEHDRDSLRTSENLADSFFAVGRNKDALELREKTLTVRFAKFGPEDSDTLASVTDLAESFEHLARHADALKLRQEALERLKVVLGTHHPVTCDQAEKLGNLHKALGEHAQSLSVHELNLAIREKHLGPKHPLTAKTAMAIACVHSLMIPKAVDRAKQTEVAMDWLKQAVATGYISTERLKKDTDLDALRDREDFKKLIADLEAKVAAEKKAETKK